MQTTTHSKKRTTKKTIWVISAIVAVVFMLFALWIVKMLLSDDTARKQRRLQTVTLVKPPPPPKIKEKPPEPEIKKEEIVEPEPEEMPPEESDAAAEDDTPPMDDLLGLDADGSGAGDGFGLKAKKGGRSLIGGDASRRFAWYTSLVQKAITERVRAVMDENGGIPEGDLKAYVRIEMDTNGRIIRFELIRKSGDKRMDEAVRIALASADIDEMPPMDMPKILKFRISSKG